MKTEDGFEAVCVENLSLAFTCRTCLNSDPDQQLISIFEDTGCSSKQLSIDLFDQLLLLDLKIAKNDGYPRNICSICVERLVAVHAFRKQCEYAREYLQQYFVKLPEGVPEKPDIFNNSEGSGRLPADGGTKEEIHIEPDIEAAASEHRSERGESSSDVGDYISVAEDELKCPTCDIIFHTFNTRDNHVCLHSKVEAFACDECELSFKYKRYLGKHKKTVHTIGDHVCSTCGINFASTSRYEYHLKTHDTEKKYKCRYCDKSFIQHTHRKNHELTHSAKRSYLCNICGKSFRHECSLKTHLKTHEETRKYACNICHKHFAQKGTLKVHLAVHNNVRAYQCEQCGKKFTQQGTLMKHLTLHNAEKSHCCEFCNESFLRIRDLRRHHLMAHGKTDISIRFEQSLQDNDDNSDDVPVNEAENKLSKKPKEFPYGCDLCSRSFRVPSSLAKHIKVHSEERKFICTECGNTFKKPEHLKLHINGVHLKRKPYSCEVCSKSFARVGDRNVHMRTHLDEKPHQCSFCGKGFNLAKALRAHIRQHTGEKPFLCIICNAGFICYKALASHTRRLHAEDPQVLRKVDELAQTMLMPTSSAVEVGETSAGVNKSESC